MMKRFNLKSSYSALLGAGILSMAMVGCGSDGKDGEDGKDGVVGVNINSTSTLKANFTSATVENGKVTVDFELANANGVAVLGLTKEHDLRFGIAQLAETKTSYTDKDGVTTEFDNGLQWQAYINASKEPGTLPDDTSHLNPSTQTQAGVEKAGDCDDCLVDNGDGSYHYTYQIDISKVTEPVAIDFGADNTHRATLELELPQTVANAHYDWQPSSGLTEGIQTRDVVSIESCYTCHQPETLAFHGGRRIDLENCASCHTPTSGDPESGNSVDWTYMIHAIHKGENRKTYAPDSTDPLPDADGKIPAPYKVIGYKGSVHDYSKVMYPQKPAADCAACHVEGEGAPANADLFKADKSNEACIACHTTMPKAYHDPDDRNCISCHVAEGYARSAEEAHGDATKRYKASIGYSASFSNINVTNNGTKDVLTFDVQILDGEGQPVAKEFIANPSRYTHSSIYFSWDIDANYPAYEDGSKYSDRGLRLLDTSITNYNETTKTFSVSSANASLLLPAELEGKSVELFAGVATCFASGGYGRPLVEPKACEYNMEEFMQPVITDYAYIQDAPLRFTWNAKDTSEPATARRAIIDTTKCQGCHNQEIYHYDNGVNCQACHTEDKGLKSDDKYPGGKKPTSFAYKAHLASGHYLKYSGLGSGTVVKTDCATCHADDGIELGRAESRVWRYGDTNNNGADVWVSSDAGSCLSCHQKYLSDAGKAHIESFGGIIDGTSKEDVLNRQKESCSTCHTPAQINQLHGN
ncbi:OmcA/MtrC family decaheme c-type cytochrome [Shewanella submarina]|uniref:OmcA/MtrC family decaheme c-type cytochrome n=1 Tax=Shewanella submarina TaxID=2016376 RepID=A0ABV7GCZ6_9GAMM|nr:OmcA/MtrC family decaheme c-type cytochrome [Shewanella submarina]MCL1036724.1 OmcA/MtrC family decaheme c-type cytochrome [Shewanella submarina]